MDENKRKSNYTADDIHVLQGLEGVRKRPAMYIGSTNTMGLHHLVWEVVDNAVDEALSGYGTNITVTVHKDGSVSVLDEGRGIPVGINKETGKSALDLVFSDYTLVVNSITLSIKVPLVYMVLVLQSPML